MKIIRPFTVTDASVISASVPETEATWSAATTYALNAIVKGNTVATKHRVYQSLQAGNLNKPLTDGAWWLDTGPTNLWRLFDTSVTSQTERTNDISVTIVTNERVDSIALLNIEASSATVTMTDSVEGLVFSQTYNLVSDSGVNDWYAYFFEPIERRNDLLITGLPPYNASTITITLNAPGTTAKAGAFVLGLSKQIGRTDYGAGVGIVDYSRKERDDFGNDRVVERAFSKRANFTVYINGNETDQTQILLSRYRATPIVYVGDDSFGSTIIYGFYKDFNIEIAFPGTSICTITIEGLT